MASRHLVMNLQLYIQIKWAQVTIMVMQSMVVIDNIQQTPGVLENDQKLLTPILSSLEISVKVYLFSWVFLRIS